MQYSIKIDAFEGPLDLLLHLVQRFEIDIYDIPVSEITKQYLDYIHTMQVLKLDIASEYLVMAASLLEIKSRMLLPKHEEIEDEFEEAAEVDPREELVKRLVAYRKFKEAATMLREREKNRGILFTRTPEIIDTSDLDPVVNVSIYDLISALQKLPTKKRDISSDRTTVALEELSVQKRMKQILTELKRLKDWKPFSELFPNEERKTLVATFLAILELMKDAQIICKQEHHFSDIFIKYREEGQEK